MHTVGHAFCLGKARLVVTVAVILFPLSAFSQTPSADAHQSSADALVGLWGVEQILAPTVGGELTIDGRGPQWRASIARLHAPAQHPQNTGWLSLPGEQG